MIELQGGEDRRQRLRRLDDCLTLLEQAHEMEITVVTVALGTIAPVWSCTIPLNDAEPTWPHAGLHSMASNIIRQAERLRTLRLLRMYQGRAASISIRFCFILPPKFVRLQ